MSNRFKNFDPAYYHAGRINRKVAELPEDNELSLYCTGFRYYKEKESKLDNARPAELKKVIEFIKNVGKCKTYQDIIENVTQEIKPVNNSNDYKRYFSGLTEDAELKEFDAGRLRGFFFFEHSEKLLQLVAIT